MTLGVVASVCLPYLPFGDIGPLGPHGAECILLLHLHPHCLEVEMLVEYGLGIEIIS